jgi:Zn-dependent protease with chaperone function
MALFVLCISSLKLSDTARNRGWFSSSPPRMARIESTQIVLSGGDPRLSVTWVLPGEGARGAAALEFDQRAPLPTSTPVIFEPSAGRWIATEEIGHSRGDAMLDVLFVAIELVVVLWALMMIYVRESTARAPTVAVIDRAALAAVAKQPRARWALVRATIAIGFYLGLHMLSLAIVSLSALMLWGMVRVGRFNVAAVGMSCVAVYAVARVYLSFARTGEEDAEPGARITREEHPAFFAELESVAAQCRSRVPDAVYLMDGRNAAVSEAPRLLGLLPGKRTLLLGASLVYDSTVSELRAVLAHEFGHFVGGDTRIGGLVYAVRRRAMLLIEALRKSNSGGWAENVSLPYELYLEVFFFVTRKLSRTQELLADKLSIAVAGREAHVSELKKSAVSFVVANDFWAVEVAPLLEAGVIPRDIERGEVEFERRGLDAYAQQRVEARLFAMPTDPFDTHPSLAERIAFAEAVEDAAVARDDRPALSLFDADRCLDAVSALRKRSLEQALGRELSELRFDEVFDRFWLPSYQQQSQKLQMALPGDDGGVRGLLLIADPARFDAVGAVMDEHFGSEPLTQAQRDGIVRAALHARLVAVLAREPGAVAHFELSQPLRVTRADGSVVVPFEVAQRLIESSSDRESIVGSLAAR